MAISVAVYIIKGIHGLEEDPLWDDFIFTLLVDVLMIIVYERVYALLYEIETDEAGAIIRFRRFQGRKTKELNFAFPVTAARTVNFIYYFEEYGSIIHYCLSRKPVT